MTGEQNKDPKTILGYGYQWDEINAGRELTPEDAEFLAGIHKRDVEAGMKSSVLEIKPEDDRPAKPLPYLSKKKISW